MPPALWQPDFPRQDLFPLSMAGCAVRVSSGHTGPCARLEEGWSEPLCCLWQGLTHSTLQSQADG